MAANRALSPFAEPQRVLIVEAFVADEDPWLCDKAHRLGLLPGQLDRIRAKLNGTLSSGTPVRGRRAIVQPSFQNEGPAGPAKYADVPVKEI